MPMLPILVETILVSLGLMGVEAAVGAAKAASAAGKSPAEIAAAAAAAAPEAKIGAGAVKRAAAEGQRVHTQSRIHTEVAEGQAAKSAAASAAASKRWFGQGGRMGRYAGHGLMALFAAPILMDLLGGRGEEAGPMPGGAAGGEGDLLALMSALEGQAGRNAIDTRAQERYTSGLTQMLDREQAARAMPSTLGMGLGGLEEIIRGNEEMLGQIAHSEPMSLAQAYAMQGLYRPMEGARVDFRGIM